MTCSVDEYTREDFCCKKCPKGTHVSSNCDQTSETKCEPCPSGLYMDFSNYVDNCFHCRPCSSSNYLQTSKPCTRESDTECECIKGYHCTKTRERSGDDCESCTPVQRCPPGEGVSVPPNSTHDTVCTPCPAGTFNNKSDYLTTCQKHTRCLDLGRTLVSAGTPQSDTKCGSFLSDCHWMIPAGLWAGLTLTLFLVLVVVVCLRLKKRRRAVITLHNSESFFPPALPPDVIKYPGSTELQALTYNGKLCAEENDCTLECDGVCDGVCDSVCDSVCDDVFSQKCEVFSVPTTCMSLISDQSRAEPQEDDWPGL